MSTYPPAAAPFMSTVPAAATAALARIADGSNIERWLAVALALVSVAAIVSPIDQPRGAAVGIGGGALAASGPSSVLDTYGRLPMTFEQNAGQADESVRFTARGAGYTVFLTEGGAILSLLPADGTSDPGVVRVATIGGAARPSISGVDPQPGLVNYLTGDDPSAWQTGLPTYGGVRYSGVYPGVDVVYYGNQRQLEYDFVVAPGADPTQIRLGFAGADRLRLSEAGDLVLEIDARQLVQRAPIVYQEVAGAR